MRKLDREQKLPIEAPHEIVEENERVAQKRPVDTDILAASSRVEGKKLPFKSAGPSSQPEPCCFSDEREKSQAVGRQERLSRLEAQIRQLNEAIPPTFNSDTLSGPPPPLHDRSVVIFPLRSQNNEDPDDSFFALTTYDGILIQKRLQQQTKRLCDASFVSKSCVEKADARMRAMCLVNTVVRVRLPQDWVLQATFRSHELLKTFHAFVEGCLVPSKHSWNLLLPPNVMLKPTEQTLLDAGLAPHCTVIFLPDAVDQGKSVQSLVRPEFLKYLSDWTQAQSKALQSLAENKVYTPIRNQ